MPNVLEEVKLIYADIVANNNKFWHGKLYDDNSVYTEWGRIGDVGQSQTKQCGSSLAAEKYFFGKRQEKERKGYTVQRTLGAKPMKVDAATLVESDDTTKSLLDYLVKVNIHQITANTSITFDVGSGSFQTPLGVVTDDGIAEAEQILANMSKFVERQVWDNRLEQLINQYMRIIPSQIGRKRTVAQALYPNLDAIRAQQQILDSLKASLQALETQGSDEPQQVNYKAKLTLLPHDGAESTATFKRILKKFLESKNDRHVAAKLRLLKVYEIEIKGMTAAFESDGAKMKNIMELWHGTQAANLLSIMNAGYVVPRSGGSIRVTGRMYGDGVYFSDQSTKALNYSAGYWGGGSSNKTFMILNDVAMGKYYTPSSSFSGGCRPGYDSTFAQAGKSGVMNNEMIVYRTSQIKPKYLCEFGS